MTDGKKKDWENKTRQNKNYENTLVLCPFERKILKIKLAPTLIRLLCRLRKYFI